MYFCNSVFRSTEALNTESWLRYYYCMNDIDIVGVSIGDVAVSLSPLVAARIDVMHSEFMAAFSVYMG